MRTRCLVAALCATMVVGIALAEGPASRPARARKARQAESQPAASDDFPGAVSAVYKKAGDVELKVHIFNPPGHKASDKRPAIVFFFGGGWLHGSARQFVPQCQYFASRGMVAITAEYRVYERHQAMIADCTADAQAALRWVRANANKLGIDPDRIAASGGSSGGHLAAATAILKDFTGDKDASVSFRPNALVLFNPGLDLTRDETNEPETPAKKRFNLMARLGAKPEDLSPMDHIKPGEPPTIIFHGRNDNAIPFEKTEAFATVMKKAGNRCEVVGFEGQGHGFFNYNPKGNKYYDETTRLADQFLASLGYLKGEPTIGNDSKEPPTTHSE